jgi:2-polyprenyl-3-methyl-5-hydroxy-6-metoxy-1,4-benzoquinol methylase
MIHFVCNVCGHANSLPDDQKHRELLGCISCGCNARFRGYALALQRHLLQPGITLSQSIERKKLTGLGFSDAPQYARHLERLFSYRNTYLHTEPRLDLTDPASVKVYEPQDFIICGDVLEHVTDVTVALSNLRKLVKRGGILIFSVPYLEGYDTIEHYPNLHDWQLVSFKSGKFAIVNETQTGQIETFRDPIFHGGPGTVLEMRVFGEGDLMARLAAAGFEVESIDPTLPQIGYVWEPHCEQAHWRGRRHKSHVMVCR